MMTRSRARRRCRPDSLLVRSWSIILCACEFVWNKGNTTLTCPRSTSLVAAAALRWALHTFPEPGFEEFHTQATIRGIYEGIGVDAADIKVVAQVRCTERCFDVVVFFF